MLFFEKMIGIDLFFMLEASEVLFLTETWVVDKFKVFTDLKFITWFSKKILPRHK